MQAWSAIIEKRDICVEELQMPSGRMIEGQAVKSGKMGSKYADPLSLKEGNIKDIGKRTRIIKILRVTAANIFCTL